MRSGFGKNLCLYKPILRTRKTCLLLKNVVFLCAAKIPCCQSIIFANICVAARNIFPLQAETNGNIESDGISPHFPEVISQSSRSSPIFDHRLMISVMPMVQETYREIPRF